MVERDACSQRQEALCGAGTQIVQGASAVALEGEDVLAGPEDRLDPLADRGEVNGALGLVFTRRSDDRGLQVSGGIGEFATGIALVADDGLTTDPARPFEQLDADLTLVALGRCEREGTGRAVGREEPMQAKAPKETRVRGAVAVVGSVAERRAPSAVSSRPTERTLLGWSR